MLPCNDADRSESKQHRREPRIESSGFEGRSVVVLQRFLKIKNFSKISNPRLVYPENSHVRGRLKRVRPLWSALWQNERPYGTDLFFCLLPRRHSGHRTRPMARNTLSSVQNSTENRSTRVGHNCQEPDLTHILINSLATPHRRMR